MTLSLVRTALHGRGFLCGHRLAEAKAVVIELPYLNFPDYPERDPEKLRMARLERALMKAAGFFRVIGSETIAKECEEALRPPSNAH